MTQTNPQPDLEREAQQVRDSGILGKPGPLPRLFEFLLLRADGPAPKELEIAVEVFGKTPEFDVAQDSVVRVYVHKLRRRLDDFYARHARPERLVIPRGEYRLQLAATLAAAMPSRAEQTAPRAGRAVAVAAALAAALGALASWAYLQTLGLSESERELRAVRSSTVWAPLLADDAPIALVVGDYYLLGEVNVAGDVERLVREFHINSQEDLIEQLALAPELASRYRNLNFTYLPTAAAFALREIAPVLHGRRVRVMLMSDLNGDVLANSHIVYVGYLSGLGMLGDPVFNASHLSLGGTYDELVDPASGRIYVARQPEAANAAYTDYGYFASLRGPKERRILIIAGTRDLGVMHTAEALTSPDALRALLEEAKGAESFETLHEVSGVRNASLRARAVFASAIDERVAAQ